MIEMYLDKNLKYLNKDILYKIDQCFQKISHVSSEFIGERKIKSSEVKRVSLLPSIKNKGLISVESNLELSHALSLERDNDVLQYRTQAIKIYLSTKHFIIPDFIVKKINSYEVHEIKANIKRLSTNQLSRFELAADILNSFSIKFSLFDHHDLLNQDDALLLNISYQRANQQNISKNQIDKIHSLLLNRNFKNPEELYDFFIKNGFTINLADYFIFYENILGIK
ncbi:TPA: hypothetical protein ACJKMU_001644 [Acinetobacter baumannii]